MWTAEIYARMVGLRIRSQMQYRVSFVLLTLSSFFATLADLAALIILMTRIPHLSGWTLGELVFLYGTCAISFALTELVFNGFELLPVAIQRGEFDQVMVRPMSAFVQVLTSDFPLRRFGRLSQGAFALALAFQLTPIVWTPAKLLYFPVMIVSGAVIFGAIFVVGGALCFWTVRTSELTNIFSYGGTQLASYPLHIYAEWLRDVVIFLIPLAFVNYFPSLWILDKADPLGMPGFFPFLSPVAAVLAFAAALAFWGFGVRRYQSTGS